MVGFGVYAGRLPREGASIWRAPPQTQKSRGDLQVEQRQMHSTAAMPAYARGDLLTTSNDTPIVLRAQFLAHC